VTSPRQFGDEIIDQLEQAFSGLIGCGTCFAGTRSVISISRLWASLTCPLLAAACLTGLLPTSADAAVAFRAASSKDQNGSASTIVLNKPTGTIKGDVLVAMIAVRPYNATITAPTGFTLLNRQNNNNGNDNALAVYWKIATSSEPTTYTWSFSANTGNAGGLMAFSGVDNAAPINASAGSITTATTTTFSAPSVTPTVTNTMIVTAHEYSSSDRWTKPAGMTEALDVASLPVADSLGISLLGSYKIQATATATGALTATAASNADTGAAVTLALKPVVCGAVAADPTYFSATAQSSQVVLYWASSSPVVILRKTSAFTTEAPAAGVTYSTSDTIGTATVVYAGSAQTATVTETNGGTYYYKAFVRDAVTCYSAGTSLKANPVAGPRPAWSYTMAGGSMLNGGLAGTGTIYTSSNADAIISLNTADGTQSWTPVSTNAAVQGNLTYQPVDAGIHTVQSGIATMTTQSVLNVAITSVDLTRSVLFMTVSADNTDPNNGLVRGQLTSGTNIQFNRTGTTTTVTIKWMVATFGRAVSVQRGTTAVTAGPMNVALTAVDLSKTFVITTWQKIGSTYGADDILRSRLTSTTNLEFSHGTGTFDGTADWQVITMDGASVQSGDTTIASGASSLTVPVTAVDTTKTFLLASWTSDTDGIGMNYVRGRITSPTQLTFDRGVTGSTLSLTWYLVTLNDGSTVQSGNASFGAATLTSTVTLGSAVNTGAAVAFLSGNQRGGSTPDPGTTPNDNPGVVWFRADLTGATTLKLDRATKGTGAGVTAEAAWFVVNFASASTSSVFGGDQGGTVYYVDTATGIADWTVALTGADAVQAPTATQIRTYSNATFKAATTDDLLFAATRNTSTTNNRVYALRASDGAVVWTFNSTGASQMDYVVGTPWIDYTRNRLWVASRAGTLGTQNSLWVINTLDGSLLQSFALGHLQVAPTMSYDDTTIYVGTTTGRLYAIDANTLTQKWSSFSNPGSAVVGYVWEDQNTTGRLYFSTANGQVWCLQDNGAGAPPNASSPVWKRAVAGASTPLLIDKLYVGSTDGKVHQIDPTTGVDQTQFTVGDGTSTVSAPSTEDGSQIFVGTTAGTLYAIPLPLP
jgi:outer membrane protein assembly factor BamB